MNQSRHRKTRVIIFSAHPDLMRNPRIKPIQKSWFIIRGREWAQPAPVIFTLRFRQFALIIRISRNITRGMQFKNGTLRGNIRSARVYIGKLCKRRKIGATCVPDIIVFPATLSRAGPDTSRPWDDKRAIYFATAFSYPLLVPFLSGRAGVPAPRVEDRGTGAYTRSPRVK